MRRQIMGKCFLCNSTFSKGAMTKHLQACRPANPQPISGRGKARTTRLLHLIVEGRNSPEYWLHLEVPTDAELADLDDFLRDIWLECCGHLSAFTIKGDIYVVAPEELDEKGMNVPLGTVLSVGRAFSHEYDFGTTTELSLRVVAEREGTARGRAISVLARNDPPTVTCEKCGKPAAQVCSQCIWDDKGWLCGVCAPQHECGEDLLLPVVNSPRVGMCGYVG